MQGVEVEKEYSRADDKGVRGIILRAKQGVFLSEAYAEDLNEDLRLFGQSAFLLQTRDGKLLVIGSETRIMVYLREERKVIFEGDFKYIYWMSLSPNEQYLQILDKITASEGRSLLFALPGMKLVAEHKETPHSNYYLKHSYPLIRFTADDKVYFRYCNKQVEVYSTGQEKIGEINTGMLEFFEVSRCSSYDNYMLTCLFLDKKTNEGNLSLFRSGDVVPSYEKNIKKAEEIKVRFSPCSNQFLMELQTYFDPTGKSYYGEYGLYHYEEKVNKIAKVNTAKGPVHDFSWDRTGINFIVISGFMPATITLYSNNNEPKFEFGQQHKNQIIWSHQGRLVCFAGFGNLTGEMEIWDLQKNIMIGACKSNSASYCEWSADDRKLITAILTPRLRVDNCFKVFSYTGVLLHKMDFKHTELYEAVWLNTREYEGIPGRGLSPGRKKGANEVKKFMSFGASLNLDSFTGGGIGVEKQSEVKLVPGQHPDDLPKPKKKRKKYNKREEDLTAEGAREEPEGNDYNEVHEEEKPNEIKKDSKINNKESKPSYKEAKPIKQEPHKKESKDYQDKN